MCLSGASVAAAASKAAQRLEDARSTAGFDGCDTGLDLLDVLGSVQLRRLDDPLERRVEGDHTQGVLRLQQAGGFDGGFTRHPHLGRPGCTRTATTDDVHASRAVNDQEQRQTALLRLDRRRSRDGQHVVEHAAFVAAWCERTRAASYYQSAAEVLDV